MRVKTFVKFESDDGSVWDNWPGAVRRNVELVVSDTLEKILTKSRPNDFRGWMKHPIDEVDELRQSLCEFGKIHYPDEKWGWVGQGDLTPTNVVHPDSHFTRLIMETDGPFSKLWCRCTCIDELGREWEQVYYRNNQAKGLAKWPEPTY